MLQSSKVELVQQRGRLVGLQGRTREYAKCYPHVRMNKFKEDLLNVQSRLASEQDSLVEVTTISAANGYLP